MLSGGSQKTFFFGKRITISTHTPYWAHNVSKKNIYLYDEYTQ